MKKLTPDQYIGLLTAIAALKMRCEEVSKIGDLHPLQKDCNHAMAARIILSDLTDWNIQSIERETTPKKESL